MKSRTTRKWLAMALVLLAAGAFAMAGLRDWHQSEAEVYRTFDSPDQRFQVVVLRNAEWFAMPGQGSDASGRLQLRDARSGSVLEERKIEMVQLVDQVVWSPSTVEVKLLAEWRLPNSEIDMPVRNAEVRRP